MTSPSASDLSGVAWHRSGRAFRNRFLLISGSLSLLAVLLISLYLLALLDLTPQQWRGFAEIVGIVFVALFLAQDRVNRRIWGPVVRCLELRAAGTATPQDLRDGFAAASDLPRRTLVWGNLWWVLGGLLVAVAMSLRFESLGPFPASIMLVAAVSGGFVMTIFNSFAMKRIVAPLREELGAEIGDPAVRSSLVRPVSIATKLLVSITGVTVVFLVFAVLLSQVRATRPVEEYAVRVQSRFLAEVTAEVMRGDEAVFDAVRERAVRLGIADYLGVLDPEGGVVTGELGALAARELRALQATGLADGDSQDFDSSHVLAWRRLPDGRVLVAVSRWEPLVGDPWAANAVFGLMALVAAAVASLLAYLLSRDVSVATESLRREAERLASGDLRRGRVFESEDELGELSRSFEGMSHSLRSTVGRVAEAADRVEATAGEMARVSESVATVTAEQVRGIQQTRSSMEAINGQVREIADSSQVLNVSVEESSSSVLELGAAGEELNETASVLSARVNEVSSSIEQMVRSVKQVSENTEALAEAAVETSASMGEMATSMREVDASAEETARLSDEVVTLAESGQVKMVQTIEGMEAIREATETAEQVIRNLGSRTTEIGAIVDVIDDVADETSLLALNAAIIAAQAGEHGRAFSVVADEIKDLAERVLVSTKEIGGLIRGVQEEGTNAIGAIERGAQSVASGVDLSAEAGVSLEAITKASRESGHRIGGIVLAVREQAKAAGHVVELMERVRGGVDEIRSAAEEQNRGNEVVYRGSVAMREVAQQVRGTTEEQARGSGRITESVEGVREAVEQINSALQEQSAACRSAVEFLEAVYARTRSNEESAHTLDEVTRALLHQAEALREDVRRFRI